MLETSEMVRMPITKIRAIREENALLNHLIIHSTIKTLARHERREAELLACSTQDLYIQFVRNLPDLQDRIPQYHIASYLGITPVALSRYKARWR